MEWRRCFISISVVMVFALLGLTMAGCGQSQAETQLDSFLAEMDGLVSQCATAASSKDTEKVAELSDKVKAMMAEWVQKRNEFGEQITPQVMEKLVQHYNQIAAKFSKINIS